MRTATSTWSTCGNLESGRAGTSRALASSRSVELRASPKDTLPRDGILFVCAAGIRSQTAAKVAEAEGRTNLYNLSGGTRGWANAGLPLVRD